MYMVTSQPMDQAGELDISPSLPSPLLFPLPSPTIPSSTLPYLPAVWEWQMLLFSRFQSVTRPARSSRLRSPECTPPARPWVA